MGSENVKCHKKLYKSGKFWVTGAMFTAFAMGAGISTTSVSADVNPQNTPQVTTNNGEKAKISQQDNATSVPKQTTQSSQENVSAASSQAIDTSVASSKATSPTTKVSASSQASQSATKQSSASQSVTTKASASSQASQSATKQTSATSAATKTNVNSQTSQMTDSEHAQTQATAQSGVVQQKQSNEVTKPVQHPSVNSGKYVTKHGDYYYQMKNGKYAKGLVKINGNLQYFDKTGKQIKGQYVELKGHMYYLNPRTGNAVVGLQTIYKEHVAFNADGSQVKNNFYYPDGTQGTAYYFDKKGQRVTGLQQIKGHTYYFDGNGQMKKGYSAVFNGQSLYFDAKTGIAANYDHSQIKLGVTKQTNAYSKHNAAYDQSKASFINVDGRLTATSWYRPKEILRNGKTWQASKTSDFRPILMTWWPDKQTQVNYLNYMAKAKLISSKKTFSIKDSPIILNEAANLVQKNIEAKITAQKNFLWLKDEMGKFVKTQYQWNIDSEMPGTDHFQGGALTFMNNPLTPGSNSNFRLMNRTPTNQKGQIKYFTADSLGGHELLLANDVDNSNPVVQAEQLNWLYYLMNFGKITANDAKANFDGIRIDAVDNVDADLLNLASQYFKDAYGVNKSDKQANQHLSILEDWNSKDPKYVNDHGNGQLTMDNYAHVNFIWSLTKSTKKRSPMKSFLTYKMIDRRKDSTQNKQQPNYAFVRAHDSEVQTVIAKIIKKLYPNVKSGLIPTQAQLKAAFKVYNADMKKTNKRYTHYNIPSAYAIMLTNKDTIPRIYYGDMYTDDGVFMGKKSPYYQAIANLLMSRVKYVAGGQTMAVDKHDIMTSVRFGKGAMKVSDKGTEATRKQGVGLIVANNPKLRLNKSDKVILHMGAAHKKQAFRALMLTTKKGLKNYTSDKGAPVRYTNAKGDLVFKASDIYGVANPQVSGYVAAWVPVGAKAKQDARTASSAATHSAKDTFRSNAALDSQVIYEGFSNFQEIPTKTANYANVRIAKNAKLFKSWGVTSMQLAPQYRSSNDTSFLDSIIKNGYAFTDRYDVGFGKPTKYGTDAQLRSAIKSLHANGIQAMADFVPDQLYAMPGQEITGVTRTDSAGVPNLDSDMQNVLYVTNSKGGGKYQKKYGGEYLAKLQKLYPDLFTTKQISTGKPIDPSVKIKEWSAKYFNGSEIQGKGAGYVLKDDGTDQYFKVTSNSKDQAFLPKQLTGETVQSGFEQDAKGIKYYDVNGYQARNGIVESDGKYYYFDDAGYLATGAHNINGSWYYFLPNGVELRSSFYQDEQGHTYYYSASGRMVTKRYITDQGGNTFYFGADGRMLTNQELLAEGKTQQYFDAAGLQAKGKFVTNKQGQLQYYNAGSGDLMQNGYAADSENNWYYLDKKGNAVKGLQKINGHLQYFDPKTHVQIKNMPLTISGKHYAFDKKGNAVKGTYHVGKQIKYYDPKTATQVFNKTVTFKGKTYHVNKQGNTISGKRNLKHGFQYYSPKTHVQTQNKTLKIKGKTYHFDRHGKTVGGLIKTKHGYEYFSKKHFTQVKNKKIKIKGHIYSFNKKGVGTKVRH